MIAYGSRDSSRSVMSIETNASIRMMNVSIPATIAPKAACVKYW